MNVPNMRTFVTSVIKPFLTSLRYYYKSLSDLMFQRVAKQDEVIRDVQTLLTEVNTNVIKLTDTVLDYQLQLHDLQSRLLTIKQVSDMTLNVKDLQYIAKEIYNKQVEFMLNGRIVDPTIPDFEDPMRERIYSDEELEKFWKVSNGIDVNQGLSDEQRITVNAFIKAYRAAHS